MYTTSQAKDGDTEIKIDMNDDETKELIAEMENKADASYVDEKINDKADINHTHSIKDITDYIPSMTYEITGKRTQMYGTKNPIVFDIGCINYHVGKSSCHSGLFKIITSYSSNTTINIIEGSLTQGFGSSSGYQGLRVVGKTIYLTKEFNYSKSQTVISIENTLTGGNSSCDVSAHLRVIIHGDTGYDGCSLFMTVSLPDDFKLYNSNNDLLPNTFSITGSSSEAFDYSNTSYYITENINDITVDHTHTEFEDLKIGTINGYTMPSSTSSSQQYSRPSIATIKSDGVMEVGKYIDFHDTYDDSKDHSVRITCNNPMLSINGGLNVSNVVNMYGKVSIYNELVVNDKTWSSLVSDITNIKMRIDALTDRVVALEEEHNPPTPT